jgi:beta-barrel assembly-enhancing protease
MHEESIPMEGRMRNTRFSLPAAATWIGRIGRRLRHSVTPLGALTVLLAAVALSADGRTMLKPGWNMFSPQQDVEVGQQVSPDAERQLPMLNNSRVDNYVNALGRRLAASAPGEKYPYHFKVVNDPAINAFALPGGPIYVNRGVIESADNESQLAGVLAHEISHVALRHGTNQASKASAAQLPLAILGGLIGSDSTKAALAQLGASFAVNSILLKYSRSAESQADIMGTQILHDSAYDPRAMGQFFEKLEAQQTGRGPVEFFSNHPNPDNRIERVAQEVDALGGVRRDDATNSREFDDIKRYLQSVPGPSGQGQRQLRAAGGTGTAPDRPSGRFVGAENSVLRISHPDNWQIHGQGDALTITPRGGLVDDGQGRQALAYGVIVNIFEPRWDSAGGQQLQGRGYGQDSAQDSTARLQQSTDQLVQELRLSNRDMRVIRRGEAIRVDGAPALSTYLSNTSPIGGRETDWLVTAEHPEGLLFIVFTAPEPDFQSYEGPFHEMLRSVRIGR